MGWSCSWIAVRGGEKTVLLDHLGWVETGETVEPGTRRSGVSVCERPNGWTVLFSEDFDWADADRVKDLSRYGLAIGCQFEDKVEMASSACAAESGAQLWRVSHRNDPKHLFDVEGVPPEILGSLREQAVRQQEEDEDVDFLHETPMELAAAICGYRAEDDGALFQAARPIAATSGKAPVRKSFLDKLLAPLKARAE